MHASPPTSIWPSSSAGQELNVLKPEDAELTYRNILAVEPAHELATIGLAVVFELANRTDELFDLIEKAQATGVGADVTNFIGAMGHRRSKKFTDGLELLKKVPEGLESTRRFHLLGPARGRRWTLRRGICCLRAYERPPGP